MLPQAFDLKLTPKPWRWLWLAAGFISLGLALLGVVLPLLPTVPFVLLAAACFGRGSAKTEAWLLSHPRWGPMVRDWRAERVIPRRVKHYAWAMMTLSVSLAAWRAPWWASLCAGSICLCVAIWMAQLPEHRKECR